MTTRTEPQIGGTDHYSPTGSPFEFTGLFSKKSKSPDQLVAEALKGFTDAQAQLEVAQAAIEVQKSEHEAEIQKRTKLLEAATESSSRLGRVAERFKELLA
jgi:hypothetical protein